MCCRLPAIISIGPKLLTAKYAKKCREAREEHHEERKEHREGRKRGEML